MFMATMAEPGHKVQDQFVDQSADTAVLIAERSVSEAACGKDTNSMELP